MTLEYTAELVSVVDGDTYWLLVSRDLYWGFGFSETKRFRAKFRLKAFNCDETQGATRESGLRAKAAALELLVGGITRVVSYDKPHGDRWLADVYVLVEGAERSLGEVLFERGLAKIYP